MSNINSIVVVGRWTADVQLKTLPNSDMMVCTGTIALDLVPKKDGTKRAAFIPVVIWGKRAESTANYCGTKGSQVAVNGHLESRSYKDKKHEDVTHYVVELIAHEVQFLESKGSNNGSSDPGHLEVPPNADMTPVDDGDIPF